MSEVDKTPAQVTSNPKMDDEFNIPAAFEQFLEYFVKNYPGPDTIISRPTWHAPKIWRAALYALGMNRRLTADPGPAVETTAPQTLLDALIRINDIAENTSKAHEDRIDDIRTELRRVAVAGCAVKASAPLTLQDYGYAPGNYIIKCHDCDREAWHCDKRAIRCEECATRRLAENGREDHGR